MYSSVFRKASLIIYGPKENTMQLNSLDETRQTVKVLLIEDDEDDYLITRDLLSEIKNFQISLEWIKTYENAIKAIEQQAHDVILVDYRLGAHTGLEILQTAITLSCPLPIILLTGQGGYEIDVAASEMGAADYLVKDEISSKLLERAIRYALKNYQRANELQQALENFKSKQTTTAEELKPLEEVIQSLRGLDPQALKMKKFWF